MVAENLYHALFEWPLLQVAVFVALLTLSLDLFFKYAYGAAKKSLDEELERLANARSEQDKNKNIRESEEQKLADQKERLKALKNSFSIWEKGLDKRKALAASERMEILAKSVERRAQIEQSLRLKLKNKAILEFCLSRLEQQVSVTEKCTGRGMLDQAIEKMRKSP